MSKSSVSGSGPLISDEEFFGLLREDVEALALTRSAAGFRGGEESFELLMSR